MNRIYIALFSIIITPALAWSSVDVDRLSELVNHYHQRSSFHGNVLIRKNGKLLFEQSIGFANAEWKVSHTKDSKFMVASLSKSFTAATILQLQNQNLLSVEDLVSKYIELPAKSRVDREKWDILKIKHLLNHSGGLKRDFTSTKYMNRSAYNYLNSILFHYLNEESIFISSPGERFGYSNFGYLLLAEVIEAVGGGFYEDEVKNSLLRPLDLFNTGEYHRLKFIESMADGYYHSERGVSRKRCCDDATALRGAASLYSTADDLADWLLTLKHSQEKFGFDLLSKMTKEVISMDGEGGSYGYGLMIEPVEGTRRIYHNGHEWGYVASMSLYPEENLEIVVLSNRHGFLGFSGGNAADELSLELAKVLLN